MAEKEKNEILNPRQNNKTNRERREKEEKQIQNLRKWGTVLVIVVVVCMIVGLILGIVNKPSRKVVARVGDETISAEEFQSAVRMQRLNVNSQYQYMQQLYAMLGMEVDANTRESYAMQMSDAYKGILGQSVLSNLVDQKVMAYGAAQEGISVSDEELEERYKGLFGYFPNGTPVPTATSEPFEATPTVTDEQLAILKYTETPLPTEIPAEGEETAEEAVETVAETAEEAVETVAETAEEAVETVAETAEEAVETVAETAEEAVETVVETAEETVETVAETAEEAVETVAETAEEAVETVEETAEATIAPTPTVYTEELFKSQESLYFANNFYYSKDFFKGQLRSEMLQQKVEDKLRESLPRSADMVWARHILVETEEEAKAALERINAGEDWADVAAELSTDTNNASKGGDLGWFTEGTMVQEFNDAAFSQEVGTISDPVQTSFGWHLIQVIAHEEHPYTSSQYENALNAAYQTWLDGYASQLEISMENINDLTPTDPAFVG
ncbi:MAG: peptidylprolyl isomerase [Anaerolineaceae bacterium]|nr:peptidylprolyl isomerase [Anaerolineaceae bacterium]